MLTRAADGLDRLLLPVVVVVGAVGAAFPGPGRSVDGSGGIGPTLAVLVLTAGWSIELAGLRQLRVRKARVVLALAASTVVLPLLAWALSRAAPAGVRDGLLAVGVAPAEVASVALTALSGGEVPVAAVLLVASTVVTVVASGPVLALLVPTRAAHPVGLLATLALVVALPLAVGAALAPVLRRRSSVTGLGRFSGLLALLVLLWEVASQVRLDVGFLVAAGPAGRLPRRRRLAGRARGPGCRPRRAARPGPAGRHAGLRRRRRDRHGRVRSRLSRCARRLRPARPRLRHAQCTELVSQAPR